MEVACEMKKIQFMPNYCYNCSFVFSLRLMFVVNVLQPKFSVSTRTWDVKPWYELVYTYDKFILYRSLVF